MSENQRYDAKIIGKELVGNKKCYFLENEELKFYWTVEERARQLSESVDMDTLGFTINWPNDSVIADVKEGVRGFSLSVYDFIERDRTGFVRGLCFADAEIIGKESKILRKSKSPEQYLKKWIFQNRFKQKHGFDL